MKRTIGAQVNHLEVLHQVCRRKGWRMTLELEGAPGELTRLGVRNRDREYVWYAVVSDAAQLPSAARELLGSLQRGKLVMDVRDMTWKPAGEDNP